jgi:hypothetical protein
MSNERLLVGGVEMFAVLSMSNECSFDARALAGFKSASAPCQAVQAPQPHLTAVYPYQRTHLYLESSIHAFSRWILSILLSPT